MEPTSKEMEEGGGNRRRGAIPLKGRINYVIFKFGDCFNWDFNELFLLRTSYRNFYKLINAKTNFGT